MQPCAGRTGEPDFAGPSLPLRRFFSRGSRAAARVFAPLLAASMMLAAVPAAAQTPQTTMLALQGSAVRGIAPLGQAVVVRVSVASPVERGILIVVTAEKMASSDSEFLNAIFNAGDTAVTLPFAGARALSTGEWYFTARPFVSVSSGRDDTEIATNEDFGSESEPLLRVLAEGQVEVRINQTGIRVVGGINFLDFRAQIHNGAYGSIVGSQTVPVVFTATGGPPGGDPDPVGLTLSRGNLNVVGNGDGFSVEVGDFSDAADPDLPSGILWTITPSIGPGTDPIDAAVVVFNPPVLTFQRERVPVEQVPVELTVVPDTIPEGMAVTLTATLDETLTDMVTLTIRPSLDGIPQADLDFSLEIAANQISGSTPFTPSDDGAWTFAVEDQPVSIEWDGVPAMLTATLVASVVLTVVPDTIPERMAVTLTATLAETLSSTAILTIRPSLGGTPQTDFDLVIDADQLSGTAPFTPPEDGAWTFSVEVQPVSVAWDGNPPALTATPVVPVRLTVDPGTIPDGMATTLTATLDDTLTDPVALTIRPSLGGAPRVDLDFSLEIAANQISGTAPFTPPEGGAWTFSVEVQPVSVAWDGAVATLIVTLVPVSVALAVAPDTIPEGMEVTLTATLASTLADAVTLTIRPSLGSAPQTDFSLEIAANQISGTASFTPSEDGAWTFAVEDQPAVEWDGNAPALTATPAPVSVALTVAPGTIPERTAVTLTAMLTETLPSTATLTIRPSLDDTPQTSSDFDLEINPNQASGTAPFTPPEDGAWTFAVEEILPSSVVWDGNAPALTATSAPVSVALTVAPGTITEGMEVTLTATLGETLPSMATLMIRPSLGGTPRSGSDFDLVINPDQASGTAPFTPPEDGAWTFDVVAAEPDSVEWDGNAPALRATPVPILVALTVFPEMITERMAVTWTVTLAEAVTDQITVTIRPLLDGVTRPAISFIISANQLSGSTSFTPPEVGEWTFRIESLSSLLVAWDRNIPPPVTVTPGPVFVALTVTPDTITEGMEVTLTATLASTLTDPITLTIRPSLDDTPRSGSDFPLVIDADQLSGTASFMPSEDGAWTFAVENQPASVEWDGNAPALTATPAPVSLALTVIPDTITEGMEVTLTATLAETLPSTATLTVRPSLGGTLRADLDFSLEIAANQISGTAPFTPPEDGAWTFAVEDQPDSVAWDGTVATLTATPVPVSVALTVAPGTIPERTAVTLTATLASTLADAVTLTIRPSLGGAPQTDFDLVIDADQLSGSAPFTPSEDGAWTFSVAVQPDSVAWDGTVATLTATPAPVSVALTVAPGTIPERMEVTLTATLASTLADAVTLTIRPSLGGAPQTDFDLVIDADQLSGSAPFTPSEDGAWTFSVAVQPDSVAWDGMVPALTATPVPTGPVPVMLELQEPAAQGISPFNQEVRVRISVASQLARDIEITLLSQPASGLTAPTAMSRVTLPMTATGVIVIASTPTALASGEWYFTADVDTDDEDLATDGALGSASAPALRVLEENQVEVRISTVGPGFDDDVSGANALGLAASIHSSYLITVGGATVPLLFSATGMPAGQDPSFEPAITLSSSNPSETVVDAFFVILDNGRNNAVDPDLPDGIRWTITPSVETEANAIAAERVVFNPPALMYFVEAAEAVPNLVDIGIVGVEVGSTPQDCLSSGFSGVAPYGRNVFLVCQAPRVIPTAAGQLSVVTGTTLMLSFAFEGDTTSVPAIEFGINLNVLRLGTRIDTSSGERVGINSGERQFSLASGRYDSAANQTIYTELLTLREPVGIQFSILVIENPNIRFTEIFNSLIVSRHVPPINIVTNAVLANDIDNDNPVYIADPDIGRRITARLVDANGNAILPFSSSVRFEMEAVSPDGMLAHDIQNLVCILAGETRSSPVWGRRCRVAESAVLNSQEAQLGHFGTLEIPGEWVLRITNINGPSDSDFIPIGFHTTFAITVQEGSVSLANRPLAAVVDATGMVSLQGDLSVVPLPFPLELPEDFVAASIDALNNDLDRLVEVFLVATRVDDGTTVQSENLLEGFSITRGTRQDLLAQSVTLEGLSAGTWDLSVDAVADVRVFIASSTITSRATLPDRAVLERVALGTLGAFEALSGPVSVALTVAPDEISARMEVTVTATLAEETMLGTVTLTIRPFRNDRARPSFSLAISSAQTVGTAPYIPDAAGAWTFSVAEQPSLVAWDEATPTLTVTPSLTETEVGSVSVARRGEATGNITIPGPSVEAELAAWRVSRPEDGSEVAGEVNFGSAIVQIQGAHAQLELLRGAAFSARITGTSGPLAPIVAGPIMSAPSSSEGRFGLAVGLAGEILLNGMVDIILEASFPEIPSSPVQTVSLDGAQFVITLQSFSFDRGAASVFLTSFESDVTRTIILGVDGTEFRWLNDTSDIDFSDPANLILSANAGIASSMAVEVTDALGNRDLSVVSAGAISAFAVEVMNDDGPVSTAGDELENVRAAAGVIRFDWNRWPAADNEEVSIDAVSNSTRTQMSVAVSSMATAERLAAFDVLVSGPDGSRPNNVLPEDTSSRLTFRLQGVAGAADCMSDVNRPCIHDVEYPGGSGVASEADVLLRFGGSGVGVSVVEIPLPGLETISVGGDSGIRFEQADWTNDRVNIVVDIIPDLDSSRSEAELLLTAALRATDFSNPLNSVRLPLTVRGAATVPLTLTVNGGEDIATGASFDIVVSADLLEARLGVGALTEVMVTVTLPTVGVLLEQEATLTLTSTTRQATVTFTAPQQAGTHTLSAMATVIPGGVDEPEIFVDDVSVSLRFVGPMSTLVLQDDAMDGVIPSGGRVVMLVGAVAMPGMDAMVRVTATPGVDNSGSAVMTNAVALPAASWSTGVMTEFSRGALSAGNWILTADVVSGAPVVSISAEVQLTVEAPSAATLTLTSPNLISVLGGAMLDVAASSIDSVLGEVIITLMAETSVRTLTTGLVLSSDNLSDSTPFAGLELDPAVYTFSATDRHGALRIEPAGGVPPMLRTEQGRVRVATPTASSTAAGDVTLMVEALRATGETMLPPAILTSFEVVVTVSAERTGGAGPDGGISTASSMVVFSDADSIEAAQKSVIFPSLPPGEWSFMVSSVDVEHSAYAVDSRTVTIQVVPATLTLTLALEGNAADGTIPSGSLVAMRVGATEMPEVDAMVRVTAMPGAGNTGSVMMTNTVALPAADWATGVMVEFSSGTLSAGGWILAAEVVGAAAVGTSNELQLTVEVPSPTTLTRTSPSLVSLVGGATVELMAASINAELGDIAVTVTATPNNGTDSLTQELVLSSDTLSGVATFESLGQVAGVSITWAFTAADQYGALDIEQARAAGTARVFPGRVRASTPTDSSVAVGDAVTLMVESLAATEDTMLPPAILDTTELTVTVSAVRTGGAAPGGGISTASSMVTFSNADGIAVAQKSVIFPGFPLGEWSFRVSSVEVDGSAHPGYVVDSRAATIQVVPAMLTLTLALAGNAADGTIPSGSLVAMRVGATVMPDADAMVRVTAMLGTGPAVMTNPVVLPAADWATGVPVEFSSGTLSAGDWTLAAEVVGAAAVVGTSNEVQLTVEEPSPATLTRTSPSPVSLVGGATVELVADSINTELGDIAVTVTATPEIGTSLTQELVLSSGTLSGVATFASLGPSATVWTFTATDPYGALGIESAGGVPATVRTEEGRVRVATPLASSVAAGEAVTLMVEALAATGEIMLPPAILDGTELTVTVSAVRTGGALVGNPDGDSISTASMDAVFSSADGIEAVQESVTFSSLPPGDWMFMVSNVDHSDYAADNRSVQVQVMPAVLTLALAGGQQATVQPQSSVTLELSSVPAPVVPVLVSVVASDLSGTLSPQTQQARLGPTTAQAMVVFEAGILASAVWNFSAVVEPLGVTTMTGALPTVTVEDLISVELSVLDSAMDGAELTGRNVNLLATAASPLPQDTQITATLTRMNSDGSSTVADGMTTIAASETTSAITISAGGLSPGTWMLEAAGPQTVAVQLASGTPASISIVRPQLQVVVSPAGRVAVGRLVNLSVMVVDQPGAPGLSEEARVDVLSILTDTSSTEFGRTARGATLPAGDVVPSMLLGSIGGDLSVGPTGAAGTLRFTATVIPATAADVRSIADITVAVPQLTATGASVSPGDDLELALVLDNDLAPAQDVTIEFTAMRGGDTIERELMLTQNAALVSNTLSFGTVDPGTWVISASVMPAAALTVNVAGSPVTVEEAGLTLVLLEHAADGEVPSGSQVQLQVTGAFAATRDTVLTVMAIDAGGVLSAQNATVLLQESETEATVVFAAGLLPPGDWYFEASDAQGLYNDTPLGSALAPALTVQMPVATTLTLSGALLQAGEPQRAPAGATVTVTVTAGALAAEAAPVTFTLTAACVSVSCGASAAGVSLQPLTVTLAAADSAQVISMDFPGGALGAGTWEITGEDTLTAAGMAGAVMTSSVRLELFRPQVTLVSLPEGSVARGSGLRLTVSADSTPGLAVDLTVQALRSSTEIARATVLLTPQDFTDVAAELGGTLTGVAGALTFTVTTAEPADFLELPPPLVVEVEQPVVSFVALSVTPGGEIEAQVMVEPALSGNIMVTVTAMRDGGALVGADSISSAAVVMQDVALGRNAATVSLGRVAPGSWTVSLTVTNPSVLVAPPRMVQVPESVLALALREGPEVPAGRLVLVDITATPSAAVAVDMTVTARSPGGASVLREFRLPQNMDRIMVDFATAGSASSDSMLTPGNWYFTAEAVPTSVVGTATLGTSGAPALTVQAPIMAALMPVQATVPLGMPVELTLGVVSGMVIPEGVGAVNVTITAMETNGATSVQTVTLSPTQEMMQVVFAPRVLGPGDWTFTGTDMRDALQVAPADVEVVQPVVTAMLVGESVRAAGSEVRVAVSADRAPGETVLITVMAEDSGGESPAEESVTLSPTQLAIEAVFNGLPVGSWTLSAVVAASTATAPLSSLPAVTLSSVNAGSVQLAVPQVRLMPQADRVGDSASAEIEVIAEINGQPIGPSASVNVTVTAVPTVADGMAPIPGVQTVNLGPGTAMATATFPAADLDMREWIFSAVSGNTALLTSDATTTVTVGLPRVQLSFGSEVRSLRRGTRFVQAGTDVSLPVTTDGAPDQPVVLTVTPELDGVPQGVQTLSLTPDASAGMLTFTALAAGSWVFAVTNADPSGQVSFDGVMVALEVYEPHLLVSGTLSLTPARVVQGATVTLGATRAAPGAAASVPVLRDGTTEAGTLMFAMDAAGAQVMVGAAAMLGTSIYTLATTTSGGIANADEEVSSVLQFMAELQVVASLSLELVASGGDARVGQAVTVTAQLQDNTQNLLMLSEDVTLALAVQPDGGSITNMDLVIPSGMSMGQSSFTPSVSGTWAVSVTGITPDTALTIPASEVAQAQLAVGDALLTIQDAVLTEDDATIELAVATDPAATVTATVTLARRNDSDALSAALATAGRIGPLTDAMVFTAAGAFSVQFIDLAPGTWEIAVATQGPVETTGSATQEVSVTPPSVSLALRDAGPLAAGTEVQLGITALRESAVDVALTILATRDSDGVEVSSEVTLGIDTATADVSFAAGTLLPGVWTFTVSAAMPAGAVETDVATAGPLTLSLPEVSLVLTSSGPLAAGSGVSLTAGLAAEPSAGVEVTVTAMRTRNGTSVDASPVTLETGMLTAAVEFTAGDLFPGEWTFTATVTSGEADTSSTDTPQLTINPPTVELDLPVTTVIERSTAEVNISVSLASALEEAVMVTVTATGPGGETTSAPAQQLTSAAPTATVTLPAGELIVAGSWNVTAGVTPVHAAVPGTAQDLTVRLPQLRLTLADGSVPDPLLNIEADSTATLQVNVEAPGPLSETPVTLTATLEDETRTATVSLSPTALALPVSFAGAEALNLAGLWTVTATAAGLAAADEVMVNVRVQGAAAVAFTDAGGGSPVVLDTAQAGDAPVDVAMVMVTDSNADGAAAVFDVVTWRVVADNQAQRDRLMSGSPQITFTLHDAGGSLAASTAQITADGARAAIVDFVLTTSATLNTQSSGSPVSAVYTLRAQLPAAVTDVVDNGQYVISLRDITLEVGESPSPINAMSVSGDAELQITVTATQMDWVSAAAITAAAGTAQTLSLRLMDTLGNIDLVEAAPAAADLAVLVFASGADPDTGPQILGTGDTIAAIQVMNGLVSFDWERWPAMDNEVTDIYATLSRGGSTLRTMAFIPLTTNAEAERVVTQNLDISINGTSEDPGGRLFDESANTVALTVQAVDGAADCLTDAARPCVTDENYANPLRFTPSWDASLFSLTIDGMPATPDTAHTMEYTLTAGVASVSLVLLPQLTTDGLGLSTAPTLTLSVTDNTDTLGAAAFTLDVQGRPDAMLTFTEAGSPVLLDSIDVRNDAVLLATVVVTDAVVDSFAAAHDTFVWSVEGDLSTVRDIESLFDITMQLGSSAFPGDITYRTAVDEGSDVGTREIVFALSTPQRPNSVDSSPPAALSYSLHLQYQAGAAVTDNAEFTFSLEEISLTDGVSLVDTDVSDLVDQDVQVRSTVTGTELRWISGLTLTAETGVANSLSLEVTDANGNLDLDVNDGTGLEVIVRAGSGATGNGDLLDSPGDRLTNISAAAGVITFDWARWPAADNEVTHIVAVLNSLDTSDSTFTVTTTADAERLVVSGVAVSTTRGASSSLPDGEQSMLSFTVSAVVGAADCLADTEQGCVRDEDYDGMLQITPAWDENLFSLDIDNASAASGTALNDVSITGGRQDIALSLMPQLTSEGVASAEPSTLALDIADTSGTLGAAEVVVDIDAVTVELSPAEQTLLVATPFNITVRASFPPMSTITLTVTAAQDGAANVESQTLSLTSQTFTAQAMFDSGLPAGDWSLTAQITDGSARGGAAVSVRALAALLPSVLTATPPSAAEGASVQLMATLTAGTATVAVQLPVLATAPDSTMSTVILVFASGEASAVADFELSAVGTWTFAAQTATPDLLVAGVTLNVDAVRPMLLLLPVAQTLPAGSTVEVTISSDPFGPAVGVAVRVTATLEGSSPTVMQTTEAMLLAGDSSVMASFAAGTLTAGDWVLSLSTLDASAPVQTDSTARVSLERGVLRLSPSSQRILSDSIPILMVSSDRSLSQTLDVEATATLAGAGTTLTAMTTLPASGEATSLTFAALSEGEWTITLSADEALADASMAMASVTAAAAAQVTLSTDPATPVMLGVTVMLQASVAGTPSDLAAELVVTAIPPSGVSSALTGGQLMRSISIADGQQEAALVSFLPDVAGEWMFTLSSDSSLLALDATSTLEVMDAMLDFSAANATVVADDLVLALRELQLCPGTTCDAPGARDTMNLGLGLGDHDLDALGTSLAVPDVNGDGAGDTADIVILLRALSIGASELLLPAGAEQSIRLGIIEAVLGL